MITHIGNHDGTKMNKPNLVNIDRIKKKIRNLNAPNMTIPAAELKALDADIDMLLQYTVDLQAKVIQLQDRNQNTTQIQMDGGDFF